MAKATDFYSINIPTRITCKKKSAIERIFTNIQKDQYETRVKEEGISDR